MSKKYILIMLIALMVVIIPAGTFVLVENQRQTTRQKELDLEKTKISTRQTTIKSCVDKVESTYREEWNETIKDYPELNGALPSDAANRLDKWQQTEKENCLSYVE